MTEGTPEDRAEEELHSISADVVILGAGPAGLTAAFELSNLGYQCIVLERDEVVGGLSKTVDFNGYLFDLGGHRFYTKIELVEQIWREVLGSDFLLRPRLSRIYYRSKFFDYPLDAANVLRGLGPVEIVRCIGSFLRAHLFPAHPENNFASWVSNRFGRRLFKMFFESYTEKVWGVSCTDISADWAAERIRGLSFGSLLKNTLTRKGREYKNGEIKTLIREFNYPRRGPGMMWSRMQEIIEQRGSHIVLNTPVEAIDWENGRVAGVQAGGRHYRAKHFISTLAIRDFFAMLHPSPPADIAAAALGLGYRDFITVGLVIRRANLFPDNWIYVHEPSVKVGRIQNYTNWSPEMSPEPGVTSLGMEYFCTQDDELWRMSDSDLLALARRELVSLALVDIEDIVDGVVIRVPKAYPLYDHSYRDRLQAVRRFLAKVPNLQLVGRNGMHRYNNQDHSMLTAWMAARNITGAHFDVWQFHEAPEYLEEGIAVSNEELVGMQTAG